jgi:hypothetical protein
MSPNRSSHRSIGNRPRFGSAAGPGPVTSTIVVGFEPPIGGIEHPIIDDDSAPFQLQRGRVRGREPPARGSRRVSGGISRRATAMPALGRNPGTSAARAGRAHGSRSPMPGSVQRGGGGEVDVHTATMGGAMRLVLLPSEPDPFSIWSTLTTAHSFAMAAAAAAAVVSGAGGSGGNAATGNPLGNLLTTGNAVSSPVSNAPSSIGLAGNGGNSLNSNINGSAAGSAYRQPQLAMYQNGGGAGGSGPNNNSISNNSNNNSNNNNSNSNNNKLPTLAAIMARRGAGSSPSSPPYVGAGDQDGPPTNSPGPGSRAASASSATATTTTNINNNNNNNISSNAAASAAAAVTVAASAAAAAASAAAASGGPRVSSMRRRRWMHSPWSDAQPGPIPWIDLSEPFQLPLTTGYLPSQTVLNEQFVQYPALIAPFEAGENAVVRLMEEIVSQRLTRRFQLIERGGTTTTTAAAAAAAASAATAGGVGGGNVSSAAAAAAAAAAAPVLESYDVAASRRYFLTTRFYLSLGHQFHVVEYDPAMQQVSVHRYQRRSRTAHHLPSIEYSYLLRSADGSEFVPRGSRISYLPDTDFRWPQLDEVVAGYTSRLSESLKYDRIMVTLLPAAVSDHRKLDIGEEAFQKLLLALLPGKARVIEADGTYGQVAHALVLPGSEDNPCDWRRDAIVLHRDPHPQLPYHVRIGWVMSNPGAVEELVQKVTRRAKQLGFVLIQVPIMLWLRQHPLRDLRAIDLSHARDPALAVRAAGCILVERFGFIREPRAENAWYSYIHRAGHTFVAVEDSQLNWIENRMPSMRALLPESARLHREVQTLIPTIIACAELAAEILDGALGDGHMSHDN